MGAPMLAALQRAGHQATGFDIRAGLGTDIGTDATIFRRKIGTLLSVVRDADETDALLFDDQRMIDAPELTTIIVCSTLSPRYTRALRARVPDHIALIDAPLSGAQVRAQAGTLSFMLGGDPGDIATQMPLFEAMGAAIHIMGDFGAGMTAKVLNNLLAASHTAMTRMVLDWADAQGLDESRLLALIETSSGQNWLASGFESIEFARDGHASDNSIGILVKDVAAALDIAPEGASTTLPRAVQEAIRALKPRPRRA